MTRAAWWSRGVTEISIRKIAGRTGRNANLKYLGIVAPIPIDPNRFLMDIVYPDRSIFDGMVMSPFLGCLLTHGHVVHFVARVQKTSMWEMEHHPSHMAHDSLATSEIRFLLPGFHQTLRGKDEKNTSELVVVGPSWRQLSPREFAFFTVFVLTRPMANTTRYGSDPARFPVSRW